MGHIPGTVSDAPGIQWDSGINVADQDTLGGLGGGGANRRGKQTFVPLGQVADIRIVDGPPMVRDEGGRFAVNQDAYGTHRGRVD